jgi:cytoskeletal protein CcmA (bactofilin family)
VRRYTVLVLLLILLGGVSSVSANETRQGDQCVIAAEEVIEDDVFILCRTLTVDGRITGNLLGAATRAVINGQVDGDVYLLAGQLDVTGQVGDDLIFGGAVLRLLPEATFSGRDPSLMYLSLSTAQEPEGQFPGSIIGAGYQTRLDGTTVGNVNYWGSALQIDGTVGGDVEATVGDSNSLGLSQVQAIRIPFEWNVDLLPPGLNIGTGGQVGGNLRYTGLSQAEVAGQVTGRTEYVQTVLQPDLTAIITPEQQPGLGTFLTQSLREFITLLVIGVIALFAIPRSYLSPARTLRQRPLRSFGAGLLSAVASLPALLLAILIALLIAFILAFVRLETLLMLWGIGASTLVVVAVIVLYFLIFFVSRALACLWIGRWLVRVTIGDDNSRRVALIGQGVGCTLLALLSPVPWVGLSINVLAILFGLGAMVLALRMWLEQLRGIRFNQPVRPLDYDKLMEIARKNPKRVPPPPLIELPIRPPGLDNLPPGFTWWDDDSPSKS